ncbi:MAG TPA: hypothetical protein VM617_04975, partial [Thermoanaerobaculia bacterium]|nr:hypothetical protein [Thermoanaerobaculia bacterium]
MPITPHLPDRRQPTAGRTPCRASGVLAAALLLALGATVPAGGENLLATSWAKADLFGGDVRSLAMAPDDPDVVYAGTTHGQLYRSLDGGATWSDAGPAVPFPGWVVSDLAFDAERPGRLWAALWGLWGGGLVAYSDDGGA